MKQSDAARFFALDWTGEWIELNEWGEWKIERTSEVQAEISFADWRHLPVHDEQFHSDRVFGFVAISIPDE